MDSLQSDWLANLLGYVASISFTLQYIPQSIHNYRRKSMLGFSAIGIVIKLIGASFLAINSYFLYQPLSVIIYGFFNVAQHDFFMIQFSIYPSKREKVSLDDREPNPPSKLFLVWLLFPIVPYFLAVTYPEAIHYTTFIKPVGQIVSHLPQVFECIKCKTTSGISFMSQHLNLLGGFCGLYMCWQYSLPFSIWLIYIDSLMQAISIYLLAVYYREPIFIF